MKKLNHYAFNSGRVGHPRDKNQWQTGQKDQRQTHTDKPINTKQSLNSFIVERESENNPNVPQFFEAMNGFLRSNPSAPDFAAARDMKLRELPIWMLFLLVTTQLIPKTQADEMNGLNMEVPEGRVDRIAVFGNNITLFGPNDKFLGEATFDVDKHDSKLQNTASKEDDTNPQTSPVLSNSVFTQLELDEQTTLTFHRVQALLDDNKQIFRSSELKDAYLHFDLGGEGPHVEKEQHMRSGFTSAINLNRKSSADYGYLRGLKIPALVEVDFDKPYPIAESTADEISMQGAPFLRHNMHEIARMIRPGGAVTLWVNERPEEAVTLRVNKRPEEDATFEKLAQLIGGTVIYPDPNHPKHNYRQSQQLPKHLLHEEQASFSMQPNRVVIIAGNPKPSEQKQEL